MSSGRLVERAQPPRFQRAKVVVQSIDDQAEGEVALKLGRPAAKDEITTALGAGGELRQQPRFADSRFPDHLDKPRLPGRQAIEDRLDLLPLRYATDKLPRPPPSVLRTLVHRVDLARAYAGDSWQSSPAV